MNVEQVKQSHTMREVVESYGVRVKNDGMCYCPIHGEKNASMKVYKDSFYCFACGAHGDIFSFVQKMERCDFKTAFLRLGGTYEHETKKDKITLYKAQKEKANREKQKQRERERIQRNNTLIHATRILAKQCEPLSEDWLFYMDLYYKALITDENLKGGKD